MAAATSSASIVRSGDRPKARPTCSARSRARRSSRVCAPSCPRHRATALPYPACCAASSVTPKAHFQDESAGGYLRAEEGVEAAKRRASAALLALLRKHAP